MEYDLDLTQTRTGYVSGEPINVALLTAWLTSGGITVTSIAADLVDPWIIHVDASAEPDMTDSWPLFWNNVGWQTGDPLPTPPDIEAGEPPDEAPPTVTYTLDLADTALGFTPGNTIRVDQISQYLTDKGNDAQSVTADTTTGIVTVVRLASGSNISGPNWAAYNGPASVTVYGQTSIGEAPVDAASLQSPQQGTRYGDGSSATGVRSTAVGTDATASGQYSSAFGDGSTASGFGAVASGTGSVASGSGSTVAGNATASGDGATAVGNTSLATGHSATAVGVTSMASGDDATAVGNGATVNIGSDRSIAIGVRATVPASTPDTTVIRTNSVEFVPSRVFNAIDPTTLKLHASDGSVHTLGVNATTGVLTIDGIPVLTAIGTGYITSAMILDGTIALADLSAAVIANFATAAALSTEVTNRTNADLLKAPLASPVFTGAPTIPSTGWTNAQHDHSAANKGGAIPQSSITNLVTDLAAKAAASALTAEITSRTNADTTLQTNIDTKVSRSFVAVDGATISTAYTSSSTFPVTVGSFNLALPNDGKIYDVSMTGRYSGRRTTSGTPTTARIGCSIDGNDRGGPIRAFYAEDNEYSWDHTVAIVGAGQNVSCAVIITATSFTGGLTSAGWNGIATATPRS